MTKVEQKKSNKQIAMEKKLERRAKRNKKCHVMKEGQEDICRFVTIKFQVFVKEDNDYKRVGSEIANGLQIQNKVYLNNGRYKLINRKSARIIEKHEGIPDWANERLTKRYESFIKSREDIN